MPDKEKIRIGQFDQVKLLTTKNVSYVSAPPGTKISPHGLWSVVSVVVDDLLLAKKNILIRIPVTDVLLVAGYNLDELTSNLGRLSRGKIRKENSSSRERSTTSD
jgi:hypothetical protein